MDVWPDLVLSRFRDGAWLRSSQSDKTLGIENKGNKKRPESELHDIRIKMLEEGLNYNESLVDWPCDVDVRMWYDYVV